MTWTFWGAFIQPTTNRLRNIEQSSVSGEEKQVEVSTEETTFESDL